MSQHKIWLDDTQFYVELRHVKWRTIVAFPITELAQGASLSRMMNQNIKKISDANQRIVDPREIRSASREALPELRVLVEDYFAQME